MVICCDILSECALNADLIDASGTADDAGRKMTSSMTVGAPEDPNGEDGDDDDEEYVDEDDDGVRH